MLEGSGEPAGLREDQPAAAVAAAGVVVGDSTAPLMPGRNDEGKGRDHDWRAVAAVGSCNSAQPGSPAETNDDLAGRIW